MNFSGLSGSKVAEMPVDGLNHPRGAVPQLLRDRVEAHGSPCVERLEPGSRVGGPEDSGAKLSSSSPAASPLSSNGFRRSVITYCRLPRVTGGESIV